MKVLQIGAKNYPPAHGGTETVVHNLVQSLSDQIEFDLLVEWEQELVDNVEVIPKNLNYFKKMLYFLEYARKNNVDIIHFHNEKYIPMAILLSAIFRKIVLTVHGVHFRSPKWNYFVRGLFWVVDVLGSIFITRLVHCSEYDQRAFKKLIFFRKTYYVNNGTKISDTAQVKEDLIHKDTYIFLGRITPAKNVLKLVESAEKQMIKVDIYGRLDQECPEYCSEFMRLVKQSKFVNYKGVINHDKVFSKIKEYKAFLYITIMEGLPLAVLEAASCGLPLILSNIPHHTYLNLPKVWYVDFKNPILPKPNELENGIQNRKYVIDNFTIKKMGTDYKRIYESIK